MCPQVKTIPVLVIRRLWSLNHTVKYFSLESGAVGNYPGTGNHEILVMIFAGARGWHTSSIKGNWTCHEQSLTFDIQESDHCQAHPCAQRKSRSLLFFFFFFLSSHEKSFYSSATVFSNTKIQLTAEPSHFWQEGMCGVYLRQCLAPDWVWTCFYNSHDVVASPREEESSISAMHP